MICPNCQQILITGAQFCNICGYTIPVYQAPEGFYLDESCGLYYQIVPGVDQYGQSGEYVTWFYPNTGEYVQSFNLAPQPVSLTIPSAPPVMQQMRPPGREDYPKSKVPIWMIVIPIVSFVLCATLAFFMYGGSDDVVEEQEATIQVPEVQVDEVVQATPSPIPTPIPDVIDVPVILFNKVDEPYTFGETVLVTVHGITGEMIAANAFIAIYPYEASHEDNGQWFYVTSTSEAFPFDAPRQEGTYEIRLYNRGDVYNNETLMMVAVFQVIDDGSGVTHVFGDVDSDFALNYEILSLLGQPNSVLKDINGIYNCRIYTDGAISETFHADYLGQSVRFPFNFQLAPDHTDISWLNTEAEMGTASFMENSWPDNWEIHGIEAWAEPYYHGLDILLQTRAPMNLLTMEILLRVGLEGFIDYIPRHEQHQRDFGMDIYQAYFNYEDYIVYAIFETFSGEGNLVCLQIFKR